MKYPAILKLQNKTVILATKEKHGVALTSYVDDYERTLIGNYYTDFNFDGSRSITREYLEGKCVKIESPEHSEFVQNLAFNSDVLFHIDANYDVIYFYGSNDSLDLNDISMWTVITIPLPPKDEPKEWPAIGDRVSLRYKFDSKEVMHTGELLYLSDNHIIIKTTNVNDHHCHRCDWSIEKPKTEAEILRDELISDFDSIFRDEKEGPSLRVSDADLNIYAEHLISKGWKKPQ